MAEEVPILYLYMYRNILNYRRDTYRTTKEIKNLMKRTIHTCPSLVLDGIVEEMAKMGLIEKINTQKYYVLANAELRRCLRRLKSNTFPMIN